VTRADRISTYSTIFYRESLRLQGLDPCNRHLARRRLHRHRPVCHHLRQPPPAKYRLGRLQCGAKRCSVCPRRHHPKMGLRAGQCRRLHRVLIRTQCHHCRCRPQLQRHHHLLLLLITLTLQRRIFQRRRLHNHPLGRTRPPTRFRRHHRRHHQLPRFRHHPHHRRCHRHLCQR